MQGVYMNFSKKSNLKNKILEKSLIKTHIINTVIIFIVLFGCFLMLELSSGGSLQHLSTMPFIYKLLNCGTLGVIFAFFWIICNRLWLAGIFCIGMSGIIAIINHYVLMYHGMPLSFLVLKNFSTAMNVTSSYNFSLDHIVIKLIISMLLLVSLCILSRFITKKHHLQGYKILKRNLALIILGGIFIFSSYFGDNTIKPKKTIGWLWSEAYHTYGYTACTIESITQSINVINRPEGYSTEAVASIEIKAPDSQISSQPDIILILNESFYDLKQVADFDTDVPYLQNIENMDNLLKGYAIAPAPGGGTNSSEYELLTSNSLQLMPGITPFNSLNLANANSIVSFLKNLGYATTGSHSESGLNYSREQGYSLLGFDQINFEDSFSDVEFYHKRWYETDQSLYNNLIRWYEECDTDSPRFQYLLTIQNHGSWDLNDPEHDIVHVQNDFNENTQLMNEFLTGIYLSDQAFKTLTDYFANQERPVIICMLGDHSPTFASSIIDEQYSDLEKQFRLRKVPLYIWANFALEKLELNTMSMNYVIPTLLEIANVELSPYYSYLLEAKHYVPILSSVGYYMDINGNYYKYSEDDDSEFKHIVDDYFYLEYNNLHSSRIPELFLPYKQQ